MTGKQTIIDNSLTEDEREEQIICSHNKKIGEASSYPIKITFYLDKNNERRFKVELVENSNINASAKYGEIARITLGGNDWNFQLDSNSENVKDFYESKDKCNNTTLWLNSPGGTGQAIITKVKPEDANNAVDRLGNDDGSDYNEGQENKWDPNKLCEDEENCNIDLTKFCTNPYVSRTLKFIGILISIVKVLVPALIIGLGIVDIVKIIISGDSQGVKKQATSIIRRVIIGAIIFLVPTILKTIYNVVDSIANETEINENVSSELNVPKNFKNCVNCILEPEECVLDLTQTDINYVDPSSPSTGGSTSSGSSSGGNTSSGGTGGSSQGGTTTGGNTSSEKIEEYSLEKTEVVIGHYRSQINTYDIVIKDKKGKILSNSLFDFKSSKEAVATVSNKGRISAHFGGTATITVSPKNNTKNKQKINLTVVNSIYTKVKLTKDIKAENIKTGQVVSLRSGTPGILNGPGPIANERVYELGDIFKTSGQYYRVNVNDTRPYSYYVSAELSREIAENFVNTVGFSSNTRYLFWTNQGTQKMYMFTGKQGNWKLYRTFTVQTGDASSLVKRNGAQGTGVHLNYYVVANQVDYNYQPQCYNRGVIWKICSKDNHRSNSWHNFGSGSPYPGSSGCTRFTESDFSWLKSQINNIAGSQIEDF